MPRDYASVNLTIWADPDFRALPPAPQHLYLTLWTSPALSHCGVHDWRPARMTGLSAGYTAEHIEAIASCLEARHFLVIDRDTEECLIRSWARFDGLMKQPKMAISLVNAYAATSSPTIRQVLVHEVYKIRDKMPSLNCWADERLIELMSHPSISAKDLPPVEDPFRGPFTPGLALGLPQTKGSGSGSGSGSPTPAPAPAPITRASRASADDTADGSMSKAKNASRKRPATRLPDNWEPSDKAAAFCAEKGIDLNGEAERFRLHAAANDRRQVDWHASFRMWLSNARPSSNVHQIRRDDQGNEILPPLPPRSPWGAS